MSSKRLLQKSNISHERLSAIELHERNIFDVQLSIKPRLTLTIKVHYFEWLANCRNRTMFSVKRMYNDGFLIHAHETWHEPRRLSMMGHHLRRVEGPHVRGPKLVPVANWHNDGYRAAPIAWPEESSSCIALLRSFARTLEKDDSPHLKIATSK